MNHRPAQSGDDDLYPVSLVVAVAHAGQHLQQCLESVKAQTIFGRTQVILVGAGSDDGSREVATEFAAQHPNVALIAQEAGGTAEALNRGLQEVRAPFVTFLDGADELPADALALLHTALLDAEADVAMGASRRLPLVQQDTGGKADDVRLIAGIEHMEALVHEVNAAGKLFRTASLRARELAFREDSAYSSAYVTVPLMLFADRIVKVPRVVHHGRPRAAVGTEEFKWQQPDIYCEQLALAEYLARFRADLPAARRPVLDLFLVKRLQTAALRAPEFLAPAELRS